MVITLTMLKMLVSLEYYTYRLCVQLLVSTAVVIGLQMKPEGKPPLVSGVQFIGTNGNL